MNYGKSLGQYNKMNVETAGNIELVVMCYEKAIQLLNRANTFYQENLIEERARSVQKVMDIVNELQSCLNLEKGGQIAFNLDAIYSYITRRLIEGEIQKDVSAFEEVMHILVELKGSWEEIAGNVEDHEDTIAPSAFNNGNETHISA